MSWLRRMAIVLMTGLVAGAGCQDSDAPSNTALSAGGDATGPTAAATSLGSSDDKTPATPPADKSESKTTDAPSEPAMKTTASPRPISSAALKNITFDTIKFEMKKEDKFRREMLTPAIEALNGQRVRIRGFMLPSFQTTGLSRFVLVRDNMQCCFGPGAAIFDCIRVDMTGGAKAAFNVLPVTVEGTFTIQEFAIGDLLLAIYHLDATSVK